MDSRQQEVLSMQKKLTTVQQEKDTLQQELECLVRLMSKIVDVFFESFFSCSLPFNVETMQLLHRF